jgi:hypothetical protein
MVKSKEKVMKMYPKSVDRLSVLPTILEGRASDGGSINRSIDASNSEQGTKYTGETLTGQKTSGDREHVHVEGPWAPLHPKVAEDGSETHSNGEKSLWNDETLHCVTNDQLQVSNGYPIENGLTRPTAFQLGM